MDRKHCKKKIAKKMLIRENRRTNHENRKLKEDVLSIIK